MYGSGQWSCHAATCRGRTQLGASCNEAAFGEIQKHIDSSHHELFVLEDMWRFLQEHFQGQETFNQIELILP